MKGGIIFKTALKTLLGLLLIIVIAFSVVSFAFPQNMAEMFENLGNYSFAVSYASLRYKYTGDCYDLARCAEDSILARADDKIVRYAGELTQNEKFSEICDKKDKLINGILNNNPDNIDFGITEYSYKQYIFGNLATAKYTTGNKDGAVMDMEEAFKGLEEFPANSAAVSLTVAVARARDGETALLLYNQFSGQFGESDSIEYKSILQTLSNTIRINEES